MSKLIRTTITIPEDIYTKARFIAAQRGESVSRLITTSLQIRINGKVTKKHIDPMSTIGKYSLGIKKLYKHRSDLYEEHLRRKMGY